MRLLTKFFIAFAAVTVGNANAYEATILETDALGEGVFDNTVLYESFDHRVRRQAEIEGSTPEDDVQAEVNYICVLLCLSRKALIQVFSIWTFCFFGTFPMKFVQGPFSDHCNCNHDAQNRDSLQRRSPRRELQRIHDQESRDPRRTDAYFRHSL